MHGTSLTVERRTLYVACNLVLAVALRVDSQGIVPEVEQSTDLTLGDGLGNVLALRYIRGVVVYNLPHILLEDIDKGIAGLHHDTYIIHCELVDPNCKLQERQSATRREVFIFTGNRSNVKTNGDQ
jgi:hypothetical protein